MARILEIAGAAVKPLQFNRDATHFPAGQGRGARHRDRTGMTFAAARRASTGTGSRGDARGHFWRAGGRELPLIPEALCVL